MSDFYRGSEWRRWDLYIHTPETLKNDHYRGSTLNEKWDNFYSAISSYVGGGDNVTKSIAVVGITDYLSIDKYKKVIRDGRLPNSIKLVLPNVEMRIQPVATDSPVNIHFIFDPQIVDYLDSRFFGKLSFSYGDTNFSATKDELKRLGREIDAGADDDLAYKLGISQFVPSLDSIKRVFEDEKLRSATIIGVSNSNSDGASGITCLSSYCEEQGVPSQLTLFRQSIYKFVDFIFSAKPCDIQYFLGKKSDDEQTVIAKCGSLKPCLHGSDAHELSKLFEPTDNKYCWIKSDPTFNGLRQVLYEPKYRARISAIPPEEKNDYHVIDHIKIDSPEFSNSPIYFNDKLTCIIGGKSTGKSILLHNTALAIDKDQVEKKIAIAKTSTKKIQSVKVYWRDGTISLTGEADTTHKIVYIPQAYLNRLSDENEESTEIDTIIQDIVLINNDAKSAYRTMEKSFEDYKPLLDKIIYDLIQNFKSAVKIVSEEKELGSREGIEKEIVKLNQQKDAISKELPLSEEDIKCYDLALSTIRTATERRIKVDLDIKKIKELDSLVQPVDLSPQFSESTKDLLNIATNKVIEASQESWTQSKVAILKKIEMEKESLDYSLQKNAMTRDKLRDRIAGNEAVSKLSNLIQEEEAKLEKYNELEKQKKSKLEVLARLLTQASASFKTYIKIYETYAKSVNENPDFKCSDLEFSVAIRFRTDAFCELIKNIFDKRILKTKRGIIDIDCFDIGTFTTEQLNKLIIACLNGGLPLVRSYTSESALRSILSNWYNITYSVKMDNDPISMMSPGKKALVLLKLLIDLANSKCPILIDQPEDDLDNRSIFNDLVPFIKEKKINRQIIVVTHNANVVLGGDAEEVIIANQNGTNSPNNKFQFEYCSGSIENDYPIYDADGSVRRGVLNQQGVQQHVCDILEGGEKAFDLRKHKYQI